MKKTKQLKRAMRTALLVLLLSVAGMGKGYAQTSIWNGNSLPWTQGEGTREFPFLIENAENLAYLASSCNSGENYFGIFFKLTSDINLNNLEWSPIGNYNDGSRSFQGHFDGDGHIIDSLWISTSGGYYKYAGLFGYTCNAELINIIIGGKINVSSHDCYAGGIVGVATATTVMNCTNNCSVRGGSDLEQYRKLSCCGGIVGKMDGCCFIKDCCNNNTVSSYCQQWGRNQAFAGGIIGYINMTEDSDSIVIDNASNYGQIWSWNHSVYGNNSKSTLSSGGIVGGIVGNGDHVSISNSQNEGQLSFNSQNAIIFSGGLVGESSLILLYITNCNNKGEIVHDAGDTYGGAYSGVRLGGLVGYGNVIACNCYNNGGISINKCKDFMCGGLVGYALGQSSFYGCYNTSVIQLVYGFESGSIGGLVGRGEYDEEGEVGFYYCNNIGEIIVSNTTRKAVNSGGLIGSCSKCNICDCYNEGNTTGYSCGGIIGSMENGSITRCYNLGEIQGFYYCGGILGEAYGGGTCRISNCYNTGNLSSGNSKNEIVYCGGIIGYGADILEQCYNTGNIHSKNSKTNVYSGGVAGRSNAEISNCYNTGMIESSTTNNGVSYSAGIVSNLGSSCYVKNCYNAGILLSGNHKGGIRALTNGVVTNCYYLDACNGDIAGGTPKTEDEMKSYSFPDLLNQDSIVFVFDANFINQGYPVFGDGSDIPHGIFISQNINGGSLLASVSEALAGETISLEIKPDPGYELRSLSVYNINNPSQTVSVTNNTFIMPSFDVMVSAVFVYTSVDESEINPIAVYPNPTLGVVMIEAESLCHINVFNELGQLVYDGQAEGNEFEVNLSSFESGVYLFRIETASGITKKRVILTK